MIENTYMESLKFFLECKCSSNFFGNDKMSLDKKY